MLNKNRLLKTFLDLVKIDSPSGLETEVGLYLAKTFSSSGIKSYLDKNGNLLIKLSGKGKPILLSAHMDTVEPGKGVKPIVEDGVVKTDGSTILGADNKVAVAVLVEVLKYLHTKKLNHRSLEIIFTVSEEVASLGASNLDYKNILSKEGYVFDNPNPIGTIINGSPFYNRFDISVKGKSAHSSKPTDGINVIPVFVEAMQHIGLGKVSASTLVNVGVVRSGHVRNSVPGEMAIEGEVRSFSEKEVEKYSRNIIKVFSSISKKHNASIESSIVKENVGYLYKDTDALVKKTQDIIKACGFKPILKKIWGCSDANIFLDHGIKVLNLGNGSVSTHTTREAISIDNLFNLSNLILSIVTSSSN